MGEGQCIGDPAHSGHIATTEWPLLVYWMSDVGGFLRLPASKIHQRTRTGITVVWMSRVEEFLSLVVSLGHQEKVMVHRGLLLPIF